jgi:predicted peptidase
VQSRRTILAGAAGVGALGLFGTRLLAVALPAHVKSATAITEVFGDGVRVTAIAIEYDRPVVAAKLSPSVFKVEGRTVTRVFAATSTDPARTVPVGRFVIVALSPEDPDTALRQPMRMGPPPGAAPGSVPGGAPQGPPPGMGAIGSRPPSGMAPKFRPATASVVQTGSVAVAGSAPYAASATPIATTAVRNLVVDKFRQLEFRDPASGRALAYNLFLPDGYDSRKSYPLVLFMHDAGVTGPDPLLTLKQGLGAVVWARPEEQAKRPCIVLAPQYDEIIVDDASQASTMREVTYALVQSIVSTYAVDRKRIYSTGQSGGAMMTIAMNIKYPDLFAASFIVAGQWNASLVKPMASDKLWIVVAEGDLKAFPGQNAITAVLEREGAKIARATWDGRWNAAQFVKAVAGVEAKNASVNYTILSKGTVVPPGQPDNGGSNHINTWRIAYNVEGIRTWLFRQHL